MRRAGVLDFVATALQKGLAFSLSSSFALLLLYALGNYQGFLDESQLMILDLVSVSLWAACLCGAGVLVLLVVNGIRRRRFALVRFLLTVVAVGAAATLVAVLEFLVAWIGG